MLKRNLPNAITLGNLLCGCLGIQQVLSGDPLLGPWFILFAGILDFFDGLIARALGVSSPIGKDLDSLADVVSFGVLPGFLAFYMIQSAQGIGTPETMDIHQLWPSALAFFIPVISAFRLARFNHDTRQALSFIGLPTPANGFFWAGAFYAVQQEQLIQPSAWLIGGVALLSSFILIAPLPMFSFKLSKGMTVREKWPQLLFIAMAIPALLIFRFSGFALLIALYVAFSLVMAALPKQNLPD